MIVVDIETTGMEPGRNSLLSIGAVEFENPDNMFYGECRVDKGAEVANIALKINGFTRKQINDPKKTTSRELLKNFVKWSRGVKDKKLAGDNIWFDIGFLGEYFRKLKMRWIFGKKSVELHEISAFTAGVPWSLDAVLYMVGIPPRDSSHNALNDAELTAEAISRIKYGKGLIKKFSVYPVPDIFKNSVLRKVAEI
jgi:DNA polymerase III epsilon subunit-like protein